MATSKNQTNGVSIHLKVSVRAHTFCLHFRSGTKEFLAWCLGLLMIYFGKVPDDLQSLLSLLRK